MRVRVPRRSEDMGNERGDGASRSGKKAGARARSALV